MHTDIQEATDSPTCGRLAVTGLGLIAALLTASPASATTSGLDERGIRMTSSPKPAIVDPGQLRGASQWRSLGLYGGDVSDVVTSPLDSDLALAGVASSTGFGGGLYRSSDGGDHWTPVSEFVGLPVFDVEFSSEGRAFAASGDGFWSSSDGGVTWSRSELGIGTNDSVTAVAIDPVDPARIWVGIADCYGDQPVNLMLSTDGGMTWSDRTPILPLPMAARAIAINPVDPDALFVAFGGDLGRGGVWTSADGGETWLNRSEGLPDVPMTAAVFAGERMLVGGGQLIDGSQAGLFGSSDEGASWTALHDQTWPISAVTDIAVVSDDAEVLLVATDGGGINRSEDGGASWTIGVGGSSGLPARSVHVSHEEDAPIMIGVTSHGIFRSTDGGSSFHAASVGMAELALTSIHANPLDPDEIAVSYQGYNNGGVMTTTDGGAHWRQEAVLPSRYTRVRFSPDGTLYALANGPTTVAPEGLYRREADMTWRHLGPDQGPAFESDLSVLAFGSSAADHIWLGGADHGVEGNEQVTWFSPDRGQTWQKVFEEGDYRLTTDLVVVPGTDDLVVVAAYDDRSGSNAGGARVSRDGGATWADVSSGLGSFLRVPQLALSPDVPGAVMLGGWTSWSGGGLFELAVEDATWVQLGTPSAAVNDISTTPATGGVFLALANTPLVEQTGDIGLTFEVFAAGLENAGATVELTVRSSDGGLLLATSRGAYAIDLSQSEEGIFADGFDRQ